MNSPQTLSLEEIQKRNEDKEKIINFFKSDNISYEDISKFYKKNDFEKELFKSVLENGHLLEVRTKKLFKETFNKPLNEIIKILKDPFVIELMNKIYKYHILNFLTLSFSLNDSENIHYLNLFELNNIPNTDLNDITTQFIETSIKNLLLQLDNNDYEKLLRSNKFNVNEATIKNLYDKIENKEFSFSVMWNFYKDFLHKVKDRVISTILSIENTDYVDFDSFYQYKILYDKYLLPTEDEPYESIFGYYDNVDELSYLFYEDVEFSNFLIEQLNLRKEHDNVIIENVIEKIAETSNIRNVDEYSLLDNGGYRDFLINVIEKVQPNLTEIISKDDILGMFLYKNTNNNKYRKEFKEGIKVYTDENGIDYVIVSDFTSFDELIFKEEYFNMLEDFLSFDWYDVDDSSLENYFDDLDDYNIIYIANHILKERSEFEELLSPNLVNEYITDSENMVVNGSKVKVPLKELQYKYESTEDLKKIKKTLQEIIFDNEELDEDEYDKDFIEEDIKKEMLYRALMYAQESVQYDYMWNSLIDAIGDHLGGYYWPKNDEEIPKVTGDSIYKFKDNKLLFTIDVSVLIDPIKSYGDFNYMYGNKFDWENIISYIAKEINSPTNMEYELEKASWESPDKKSYNEAFRNL